MMDVKTKQIVTLLIISTLVLAAVQCKNVTSRGGTNQSKPFDNSSHHNKHSSNHSGNHSGGHDGIHVVSWRFHYVSSPMMICLSVIVAAVVKLLFHHANFLSSYLPESVALILVGVLVGAIFHFTHVATPLKLDPRTFFLFLLPPIILDSAYSLNDRAFFDNLGTVLMYAVVGTVINCLIIGPSLYGLASAGAMGEIPLRFQESMVFGALIVAVDPVAVLAIFQEVGVNRVLYFLVFGESLLNDAVTVVLYNMMKTFVSMPEVPPKQIALGIASFFTVSCGGLSIGLVFGIITSLVTRATVHVRVVEPLVILVFAYTSYLCAEMFHWSGIISCIGCGLVQSQYAFHNISHKSYITVKYFIKMLSSTCDVVIFMFLGLELIRHDHSWHAGFILWTLALCLVARAFSVFFLTFLANKFDRVKPINAKEQFIMWYGGLRGAVSFALCETLSTKEVDNYHRGLFLTTTFTVVVFTVFIQGTTIKPLVKLCDIRTAGQSADSLLTEINTLVTDYMMAGFEGMVHVVGNNLWRAWAKYIDDVYAVPLLIRDKVTHEDNILEMYKKIAMNDHYSMINKEKCKADLLDKNLVVPNDLVDGPASYAENCELSNSPEFADVVVELPGVQQGTVVVVPERRKSSGASIIRKRRFSKPRAEPHVIDMETTVEDLRTIMKAPYETMCSHNPGQIKDSTLDIAHCLHEKHLRAERHRRYSLKNSSPTPRRKTSLESLGSSEPASPNGILERARKTSSDTSQDDMILRSTFVPATVPEEEPLQVDTTKL